ncbi:MAG TPA: LamG domain-containing protein [Methylocella sp.]|nr:LamG domain-containing protein [Methylocella sp.]
MDFSTSTIQCWIKRNGNPSATEFPLVFGKTQLLTAARFGVLTNGNATASYLSGGTSTVMTGAGPVANNVWHLLELSLSPSGGVFYIDGVNKASSANVPDANQGGVLVIGATTVFNFPFLGFVDEVSIWNTQLNTGNYTPPSAPWVGNEPGLMALYHFDGTSNDATLPADGQMASEAMGPHMEMEMLLRIKYA